MILFLINSAQSTWNLKLFLFHFALFFGFVFSAQAQTELYQFGQEGRRMAPFRNGFAKIIDKDNTYYIDTLGNSLILAEETSIEFNDTYAIEDYKRELAAHPQLFPKTVLKYLKDKKMGIISPKGDVLLEAEYDDIDIQFRDFWKIKRDGKVSLLFVDKTQLPFFDEIGYLDGDYFDVKQHGKWYLFSRSHNKIMTKNGYDGFDYCGGCGHRQSYLYAQKDGKWGVIDWNEHILIPFEYEHHHMGMRSDNWISSFSKGGKSLVIHIPTKKEFVDTELFMGLLIAKKNNLYGAYGQDGELKIPFEFERIELPNDNSFNGYYGEYLITTKQHKKGVVDLKGTVILPNIYDEVKVYDDYLVTKKQQITSLLNPNRQVVFKIEHGDITHVNDYFYSSGSHGLAIFKIKKRAFYGLYIPQTNTFIDPQYYHIQFFDFKNPDRQKKYLIAEKNKLFSFFDTNGQLLLSDVEGISELYHGPEHIIAFIKNGKTGLYDLDLNKEMIPAIYESIDILNLGKQDYIKANMHIPENERIDEFDTQISHLFDLKGTKVVGADIKQIDTIDSKRSLVKIRNGNKVSYLLMNLENLKDEELNYHAVYRMNSAQVLLVSEDDKIGKLYDMTSHQELKGSYSLTYVKQGYLPQNSGKETVIMPYKNGMALLHNENGYGYINEEGRIVVAPQYVWAFDFVGNAALVCQSENSDPRALMFKMGLINKKGTIIFPLEYDLTNSRLNHQESFFLDHAVILPKVNGYDQYYGLGDLHSGKLLLPVEYTQIRSIQNGQYLLLQKNNKFGISDVQGKIIIPVELEEILFDAPSYFDTHTDTPSDIFPLLVYRNNTWRYILKNGDLLPFQLGVK